MKTMKTPLFIYENIFRNHVPSGTKTDVVRENGGVDKSAVAMNRINSVKHRDSEPRRKTQSLHCVGHAQPL